jgi:microcin C transport system substrate-binding protein
LNFDSINRGLIQKRRVFNAAPRGTAGFSFNTRRTPFNDIRVRKALTLLINRKQMIEKIMFNQVEPMNSFFSGSKYENPSNPKNEFNPQAAAKLLAEAGWDKRDSQGRLVKNGVPLQIELIYDAPTLEPQLTVYQEDLRRAGISLNLRLITFETRVQLLQSRKFDMALTAYTGLQFPNPETSWHSSLADKENNNNITGFKNARVDELCAAYDKMFDVNERVRAIREIDGIVANAYHTALLWGAGYTRILYWNKFGFPKGYFPRTGGSPAYYWWYEPEREAALNGALKDTSVKLDLGETDDKYWIEFAKQDATPSGSRQVQ